MWRWSFLICMSCISFCFKKKKLSFKVHCRLHIVMEESLSLCKSLSSSDGTIFLSERPPLSPSPHTLFTRRAAVLGFHPETSWGLLPYFPWIKRPMSPPPLSSHVSNLFSPRWVSEKEGQWEEGSHYCTTWCEGPWDAAARRLGGRGPGSQTGRK